jgi:hypothetical protein
LPSNDRGIFTEPLRSNDRRYTYRDTQNDGEGVFMKHDAEMTSGAVIYIASFIKTGSGTQKLIG